MLRALRLARGLTVDQAAAELLCSPSKISRMETGQRGATQRDVRDLCELYGISDAAERERLMTLAREGKQQGWWQSFSLPYRAYVGLEEEALSLNIFQSSVVPGLLQVSEYTRAIHRIGVPRLDDSAIEERIKERRTRQQVLARDSAPQIDAILDEAVLRRVVGGAHVMREQLDRLIAVAEYPNVTVRVVPFEVGAHPALESNFTILDFAGQAPTVIHVEGMVGQIYLEKQQDVERYLLALEQLREMALSPRDTVALLVNIRDSYVSNLAAHMHAQRCGLPRSTQLCHPCTSGWP
jgi:transcriptional regulator with XRE-family HTH domain